MSKVQEIKENRKHKHLRAAETRKNYGGHIRRGREWMASHFAEPDEAEATDSSPGLEDGKDDDESIYSDPEFRQALDGRPNQYLDKALALFISYKCF
jgi:hypothetical protein